MGAKSSTLHSLERFLLLRKAEDGVPVCVDGVTVDLSCDMDFKDWHPLHALGDIVRVGTLKGPELIWPWFPRSIREHFNKTGRFVKLKKGDRLFVRSTGRATLVDRHVELEYPTDKEAMFARLSVERRNGNIVDIPRPLVLIREDAILLPLSTGDFHQVYSAMLQRLNSAFGVVDIEEIARGPVEKWPKISPGMSGSYGQALFALSQRDNFFVDGEAMAAFGYAIAKAEAETHLLSLAIKGLESIKSARKANAAKVAKDRANSEALRHHARKLIATDASISLTKCAALVAGEFSRDPRWVSRVIKELFELRPGGREYRAKKMRAPD